MTDALNWLDQWLFRAILLSVPVSFFGGMYLTVKGVTRKYWVWEKDHGPKAALARCAVLTLVSVLLYGGIVIASVVTLDSYDLGLWHLHGFVIVMGSLGYGSLPVGGGLYLWSKYSERRFAGRGRR